MRRQYILIGRKKTKLMIFRRKPRHVSELNIVINGTQFDRLQLFNFLELQKRLIKIIQF